MKKLILVLILLAVLASPAISDWSEPAPEFVFARLSCTNRDSFMYWPSYWPDMPPWKHDYPESDEFLIRLLHELTGIRVNPNSYKIVDLSSPEIFNYPFLYLSEPGFLPLTPKEIEPGRIHPKRRLCHGRRFPNRRLICAVRKSWMFCGIILKLAVPERELVRLDITHPIFHNFFDIDTLNMKAPYGGFLPEFWGLSDEHGRLQLIANYNNDIGDFWKYLDEGDKPLADSTRSIRLGIDYIVYAMSH